MSIPLEVVLDRAGRTPYRLTDKAENLRWTTTAMGGFGSCTFTLPGPPPFWKREMAYLGMVRLVFDTGVIWEGRVEDISLSMKDETTSVSCFGLQRLLDDVSVRRVWSMRDLNWQPYPTIADMKTGAGGALILSRNNYQVTTGQYDPTALDRVGGEIRGVAGTSAPASNAAHGFELRLPSGITLTRVMFIASGNVVAGSAVGTLHSSIDGLTFGNAIMTYDNTTLGNKDISLAAGTTTVRFSMYSGLATPVTTYAAYYDIRALGTSLTEDASEGFYGGTILNDLIGLVPGLSAGVIESGSDYTIQSIERSVRSAARSVVDEVASYYTREWRVWEDGRFDWKAVNADEPQWIATLDDLDSGSEVTSTVDGLARTLYVLYADAASGLSAESSSSASAQQNPFVKQGKTKDVLVDPGFPMTSSSSSQLSSKLVNDQGRYPLVQGRLVLPATRVIKRAAGSPLPAFMIRAGENIVVADMPKTDLFSQGRDGETLFHIVSTEANLDDGSMTLEIEGQTRRSDVLLARLAAATRSLTG